MQLPIRRPGAQPRGIPDDARKRFELLQDCRELVISRLSKVVNEALTKMSEGKVCLDKAHAVVFECARTVSWFTKEQDRCTLIIKSYQQT